MSYNFDTIANSLGAASASSEQSLREFTKTMNSNDSGDLMLFQQKMHEWTLANNVQSTTIKALRDVLSSIVQKMN
jgi:type III secretion apparatus needle protein